MAENNKTRFFYVLYSDKTRVFDQSERAYDPIYIIKWDKNKMNARTSKRSRERQVPYKILNDLSSVDLLYEEKSKRKRTLNKSLGI